MWVIVPLSEPEGNNSHMFVSFRICHLQVLLRHLSPAHSKSQCYFAFLKVFEKDSIQKTNFYSRVFLRPYVSFSIIIINNL